MELTEVMRGAASIRRFRPDPVPEDVIYRVLDAARFAPSGGNRQGWHVVVVEDAETRRRLRDLYLRSWVEHHQPVFRRMGRGRSPADAYAEHLDEVPVHLVVLVERAAMITTIPPLDASRVVAGASIYPFVHNVALALRAEGLGTTLSTVLVPEEAEVAKLLNIPAEFALAAHLGVGWPVEPHPTRLRRRHVEDFATLDRFDGPPLRAPQSALPTE
jgi:nitroreductase